MFLGKMKKIQISLYKLNKYNIPNYVGNLLKVYLKNRLFQVKCDGKFSKSQTIQAGISQGSVLGHILSTSSSTTSAR